MWQITLLRMLVIVIIGIILYFTLLNVTGRFAAGRLKRRKSIPRKERQIPRSKIIVFYILILICSVMIGFLLIKYDIRY